MMRHKRTPNAIVWALAALIVFSAVGCQKLRLSLLQGNYHFSKANQLFKDNKFSKAIEAYEKALKYNPDLKEAYQFLGESYKSLYIPGRDSAENKGRADKALAALQKALDLDPNNKMVIYSLGDMYDRMRDVVNGEKMFLKIVELEPGNMNNYYIVAEFYKRYAGENNALREKAKDMYLRRIETDPENVQGYAYMADYYDKIPTSDPKLLSQNMDMALDMHKRRLLLEPKSAELYYTMGVNRCEKARRLPSYLDQADRETIAVDSEKYLLKAIELDPNLAESYAYMRILYLNVQAKLYPERESRYLEMANQYGNKWDEARKRQLDRMKLEKELKKTI
jgi:tetratricopeptide (TPR) repeat protein